MVLLLKKKGDASTTMACPEFGEHFSFAIENG
jgi:hypothetical protein